MCQGVVGVVGRVAEKVPKRQPGGRPCLWCVGLYPGCGALPIPLCDKTGVLVAHQGYCRGVRGSLEDHSVRDLLHNSLYVLFWWAGELYQLVHKLRRQGFFPFLNPVFVFRRVPYGVIPCVHDCRQGVAYQGDDVVCETFYNEVFFSFQGRRELGRDVLGEVYLGIWV